MNTIVQKTTWLLSALALVGAHEMCAMNNPTPPGQEIVVQEPRASERASLVNLYRQYHVMPLHYDIIDQLVDGSHQQLAIRQAIPLPQAAWTALADLLTLPGTAAPHVTNIYLQDSDVTGGLPPAFSRFTNATHLAITGGRFGDDDCRITAANAPRTIRFLSFTGTQITTIPARLARLPLQALDLSGSPVQRIAGTIAGLIHLTDLNLSATPITNAALAAALAAARVTITHLNLSHTAAFEQLTTLPAEIGRLVNLRNLDISYTAFTELPAEIGRLRNLQNLDISSTGIRRLPAAIGELRNLQTIRISNSAMNNEDLEAIIEVLPLSITTLNIDNCQNVQRLPNNITRLQQLRTLDITHTPVVAVPDADEMPQLTRIQSRNRDLVRFVSTRRPLP